MTATVAQTVFDARLSAAVSQLEYLRSQLDSVNRDPDTSEERDRAEQQLAQVFAGIAEVRAELDALAGDSR